MVFAPAKTAHEGSDLAKGVRIFIENHPGIKHLHDISHKLSNILKAELEKNPKWQKFCNAVTDIKQKLKLSNIAELCPPKFRHKAHFLNVRDPLKWAFAMLNLDKDCLDIEQKTNFITYIEKPLEVFRNEIIRWNEYSNFIESVETEIKHIKILALLHFHSDAPTKEGYLNCYCKINLIHLKKIKKLTINKILLTP